ncbi:MAG: hypothetical protein L0287_16525 [Anaerolineae bacterium]|nr:hypothetical protein [Anaerolineae bacterium]
MPNIFEITDDALTAISPAVPYAMDTFIGSLPDVYITYQLIDGVPEQHADNVETARTYRVQVNIMSKTGLASLPDVDTAMIAAGFTKGPERALQKDSTTSHYGLAKDYFYLM